MAPAQSALRPAQLTKNCSGEPDTAKRGSGPGWAPRALHSIGWHSPAVSMGALTVLSPRRSVSNPSLPSVEAFQIPMLGGKAWAHVVTGQARAARCKSWDLRFRHPFSDMNVPSVPRQPQGPPSNAIYTAQGLSPPYQTMPAPCHAVPQPVRTAILEKEVPACAYQERTWHAGLVSGLIATGCSPALRSNLSLPYLQEAE